MANARYGVPRYGTARYGLIDTLIGARARRIVSWVAGALRSLSRTGG